jgi:competence protein ComEC
VRRQPAALVAMALAGGIVADRASDLPLVAWWMAAVGTLTVWYCWRHAVGKTTLLVVAVAATAAAWHHVCWNWFEADHLVRHASDNSQPIALEAVALESPTRVLAAEPSPYRAIPAGEESRLVVRCVRVRNGSQWIAASGELRLSVDGLVEGVHRGDRVRLFAQFVRPKPASNPGDFDYRDHLRGDRQLVMLTARSPECIELLDSGSPLSLTRQIDRLRSFWSRQLWHHLPPQRAAMASALLVGAEGAMPRDDTLRFRTTGTTHILVVSGLHTGIVVGVLYLAVRGGLLGRRWGVLLVIAFGIAFALLTGANPPVVRAVVLVVLAALASGWGRRVLSFNSLGVALVLVLVLNPAEVFRTGTQLSFLCVITLVAFGEWFLGRRRVDPIDQLILSTAPVWWQWLRGTAAACWHTAVASGFVWLVSLPLIVNAYGVVTPIAVVISPVLFLLLWIVLISGFAMLATSLVSTSAAAVVAGPFELAIGWLDNLVTWSSQVPLGHFWTFGPSLWWVGGVYLAAAVLWHLPPVLIAGHRWLRWLAVWSLVGCVPVMVSWWAGDAVLRCHIVDVGQGACVAIESPEGRLLLYDAGSLGSPYAATEQIGNFLWSRGHRRIDAIVISHADVDHFDAVPGLIERFEIGVIYVSPHMFSPIESPELSPSIVAFQQLLADTKIPVKVVQMGDRLRIDATTTADVLHPGPLDIAGGDNSRSVVLGIEHAGRRILLPGDLESPGLDALIADEPYDCDVLLAPHHGSRRSDPPGFADWSTPEWVVISGSQDLGIAEVTESYESRGAQVLNTSTAGCVSFELSDRGISTSTFRRQSD